MKLTLVVAAAALLAFPALSRADLVITQSVEGAMQTGQMTVKIKGDKTRADISPQMSSITDGATGDSIMIMHAQKSYMRMSAEKTKALREKMEAFQKQSGKAPAEETFSGLKATGKKQKIGEYNAEEYVCKVGNTEIHYWVAKDFPNWAKLQQQMLKNQEKSLSQLLKGKAVSLKDLPGMPVRTEMEFNGQKLSYTLVSVKEEEVSPADFEVPADYKEMTMPSFPMGKP